MIQKDQANDDDNFSKVLPLANLISENKHYLNIHKGCRCFILATGPSIVTQDLTPLKDELCIAVSQFYLHKDIRIISPRYHVIAPWHPPFDYTTIQKIADDLRRVYQGRDVTCFWGHRAYDYSIVNFFKHYPKYYSKHMRFIYYNGVGLSEDNFDDPALWDICQQPFEIRTVLYSAIQLAHYFGVSEIYLLGCDHDYLQDLKRVTDHHFYEEASGVSDEEHLGAFTTEKWFKEYYDRWRHYRLMNSFLTARGCRIYNATNGGLLDVFPRVRFDALF